MRLRLTRFGASFLHESRFKLFIARGFFQHDGMTKRLLAFLMALGLSGFFIGCSPMPPIDEQPPALNRSYSTQRQWLRDLPLKRDFVRSGTHGRKVYRPMQPRFITIHSTQNASADAWKHAAALKNGALRAPKRIGGNRIGYLIWHFTVDDHVAIQHMPTNEQGEHADFSGPGNRLSIGIEMCEQRSSNLNVTIERTAKLTALLMRQHHIPLANVVPHYHWPRKGCHPEQKNCPHFLLDRGRPGRRWQQFLQKVNFYFQHCPTTP